MPLPTRETHLWLLRPEQVGDALLASYPQQLDQHEQERYAQLSNPAVGREYLLSRALVRWVLSSYHPETPANAWQFGKNQHGRPFVTAPTTPLRFNLSHTQGLICCLVGNARDVGVDVERTDRHSSALAVAERFFSTQETQALRALPQEGQLDRFLTYWTLKEAYIKARGMGLALPLGHFSFDVEHATPRITFDPALQDNPARWDFSLHEIAPAHRVACATERLAGQAAPAVIQHYVVPFAQP